MTAATLPMVLTAFSLPLTMGWLDTIAGEANPQPADWRKLIAIARDEGLAGIEMPLRDVDPGELRSALAEENLRIIVDIGSLTEAPEEQLLADLQTAAALGARITRTTLSRVLCGERGKLEGGWKARMDLAADRLRKLLPVAEGLGLCIAIENHQDAAVEDLLRLFDVSGQSTSYGVTLDTGNPLAVGQDPVITARQLAPVIRHLHMKDYTLHFCPEGYRLVRCAAGDGVINFRAIREALRTSEHALLPGVELAAQATRTIPMIDPAWWEEFAPRSVPQFLPVLQLLWSSGRPMLEPYGSVWERGGSAAAVAADEEALTLQSIRWFKDHGGW
ncbi:MAG: sugar phosphate isomerase/epimerase [Armatimonadetes bacterium]|nr:sugar phosphate isomerase/epimerase [Armatimonadota bacterium]MDE2208012.1 sugar phosphate isomerase/epimerase [Armatimonadota bacterium]